MHFQWHLPVVSTSLAGVGDGVSELRGVAGVVVTGRPQLAAAGRAGRGAGAVRPCQENIISIFGVAIMRQYETYSLISVTKTTFFTPLWIIEAIECQQMTCTWHMQMNYELTFTRQINGGPLASGLTVNINWAPKSAIWSLKLLPFRWTFVSVWKWHF